MAEMFGEGTLSVGKRLEAAGQALHRVTTTRSASWNVESGDPQERAARAAERSLELEEATREGVAALVAAAEEEAKWVILTAKLTMVITGLTFVTLVVACVTLVLSA